MADDENREWAPDPAQQELGVTPGSDDEWTGEEKAAESSFVRAVRSLEREQSLATPTERPRALRQSGFVDMLPSQAATRLPARGSTGDLTRGAAAAASVPRGTRGTMGDVRRATEGNLAGSGVEVDDAGGDSESEFSIRDSLFGVPVGTSSSDDGDEAEAVLLATPGAGQDHPARSRGTSGKAPAAGSGGGPRGTQTTVATTSAHTELAAPGAESTAAASLSGPGTPSSSTVANPSLLATRAGSPTPDAGTSTRGTPERKSLSAAAAAFLAPRIRPRIHPSGPEHGLAKGESKSVPPPATSAAQNRWKVVKRKQQVAAALENAVDEARIYGSSATADDVQLTTNQLDVMDGRQMHEFSRRLCVLLPSSPIKQGWDAFVMLLILYTATVAPFRFGFGVEAAGWWATLEIVIDILFMVDVVQQFFAAYQVENFIVVSHKRIAIHYLQTWFVLDTFASIPVSLLDPDVGTYNRQLRIVRVWKVFRLVRLLRLLRVARLARLSPSIGRLFHLANLNPGFLRIFGFVFAFFLFSHWCACAWYFVALNEDLAPHTWVADANLVNDDIFTHYMASIYWAWSTLTTLGYGDITAQNNGERMCTMVCMLFGVSFYSYITATMSNFLDGLDAASKIKREKADELEQFIKTKHLSPDLAARVRDYFAVLWRRQSAAFNENALMSRMSAGLQNEVVQQTYKDIIPKLPLFRNKDPHFVTRVVRRFVPVQYQAGRIVAREGTRAQDMVFIFKGRVRVESVSTHAKFLDLPQGSMFGEIAILLTDKYVASYRTLTYCEFFVVHRQAFEEALLQFPDAEQELRLIAKKRLQRIKRVQERMAKRYVGARGKLAWKRAAHHALATARRRLKEAEEKKATNRDEPSKGLQGSLVRLLSRATGLSGQADNTSIRRSVSTGHPAAGPSPANSTAAEDGAAERKGGSGAALFGALVDAAVATDKESPRGRRGSRVANRPRSADSVVRRLSSGSPAKSQPTARSPLSLGKDPGKHVASPSAATPKSEHQNGANPSRTSTGGVQGQAGLRSSDKEHSARNSRTKDMRLHSTQQRQSGISGGSSSALDSDADVSAVLGDSLLQPGNLEAMDLSSPLLVSNVVLKLNFLVSHMQQLEDRVSEIHSVQAQLAARALEHPDMFSAGDAHQTGVSTPVFRVAGFGQRARLRAKRRSSGPLAKRTGVGAHLASADGAGRARAPGLGQTGYSGGVSMRSTLNAGPDPEDPLYQEGAGEDAGLEAVMESHIGRGGSAGKRP